MSAPPLQFGASAPKGWVRPSEATISWEQATSANGPLRYTVVLDGRRLPAPAGVTSMRLNPHELASGKHRVQVLATDVFGESALTAPTLLEIDGVPPTVSIATTGGGHTVTVRVSDRYSGVDKRAVEVSFGDGSGGRGRERFHHTYARAGIYRVVVHVRDKLGVSGVVRRLVSVP